MTPRDALKLYETKINLHRFDDLLPVIAEDAVFWFSDGTAHAGITAIRAVFERNWGSIEDDTYWLDEVKWIAVGDAAASCTYRFNWKGVSGGQAISGGGRGTTVLRKDNDSDAWRIVHEHLSRAGD